MGGIRGSPPSDRSLRYLSFREAQRREPALSEVEGNLLFAKGWDFLGVAVERTSFVARFQMQSRGFGPGPTCVRGKQPTAMVAAESDEMTLPAVVKTR